jgi:hypothetical protein
MQILAVVDYLPPRDRDLCGGNGNWMAVYERIRMVKRVDDATGADHATVRQLRKTLFSGFHVHMCWVGTSIPRSFGFQLD